MKDCPECGSKIESAWAFCGRCGTELDSSGEATWAKFADTSARIWQAHKSSGPVEKANALCKLVLMALPQETDFVLGIIESYAAERGHVVEAEAQYANVFLESLLFITHVADRAALLNLAPYDRDTFTETLVSGAAHQLQNAYLPDMIETRYCQRQLQYAKCDSFFPEEDESAQNTLMWEFLENIVAPFEDKVPGLQLILYSMAAEWPLPFLRGLALEQLF